MSVEKKNITKAYRKVSWDFKLFYYPESPLVDLSMDLSPNQFVGFSIVILILIGGKKL